MNEKTERNSFVFMTSWHKILRKYPAELRVLIYDAIMEYASSGTVLELEGMAAMAFDFIRLEIDENNRRYEESCLKRRAGAVKRWRDEDKRKLEARERLVAARSQERGASVVDNDMVFMIDEESTVGDDEADKEASTSIDKHGNASTSIDKHGNASTSIDKHGNASTSMDKDAQGCISMDSNAYHADNDNEYDYDISSDDDNARPCARETSPSPSKKDEKVEKIKKTPKVDDGAVFEKMLEDRPALEEFCAAEKMKPDEFEKIGRRVLAEWKLKRPDHQNELDAREHIISTIRIKKSKEHGQQDNNSVMASQARRRGAETQAKSWRDYTTSF
jgi:hypothetical protein